MARSEAQKEADKRYAAKVTAQKRYDKFIVNLNHDEYAYIDGVIKAHGMGKAEFLRWAIKELEKQ